MLKNSPHTEELLAITIFFMTYVGLRLLAWAAGIPPSPVLGFALGTVSAAVCNYADSCELA